MSVGLSDLNKKRGSTTTKAKSTTPVTPKYPAGAWSARSHTTRPWDAEELVVGKSKNRKRSFGSDAVMNEEWLNIFAAPLFWMDLTQDSRWLRAQAHLNRIEERIHAAYVRSVKTIRRVLR